MKQEILTIPARDERPIPAYLWLPENADETSLNGVLQISHGLAEHAMRYKEFAAFLTQKGFAVIANDHRGHGPQAAEEDRLGFFAENKGWEKVTDDLYLVSGYVKERFAGAPLFLLGHSMGSFIARTYLIFYNSELSGCVLSGTAGDPGLLGAAGRIIAAAEGVLKGKRHKSTLLDALSFKGYNDAFKPVRTNSDWLSRDEREVDTYEADPLCGFVSTTGLYQDMLGGLALANSSKFFHSIPESFPLFLLSGSKDPVGNFGKGVQEVYENLKDAGARKVQMKLYPDGRHEMLNEVNKEEVYNDIYNWLTGQLHG